MPYNPSTGIITAPVSVRDVQRCLGSSSGDVATLCMRPNINMWSPRKPIYSTKIGILTSADWQGGAHTLSGYKTGGGIKKAVVTGTTYLNNSGSGGALPSAIWEHDRPLNDGVCYKRLADFAGYWHTAGRMFYIGTIYGNISNIIIPTSDSDAGARLGFSMWFNVSTGQITAQELFGDCWSTFYPGVIMCCGGDYKFNYVKTTSSPISAYASSTANITINTRDFMNQMKADWTSKGLSGSPYGNYPFRKGDNWTACLVLISREFTGGDGSNHKLSGSESIVRLEYAAPTDGVYVDRRTLPMKPSKYNTIEWMKLRVKVSFLGNSVWQLSLLKVTAKMLDTASISFTINAVLNTASGGIVNVVNGGSGQSVTVNNYSQVTFSGTTGEVEKTLTYNETTYNLAGTSGSGNKICAGTLTFVHSTLGSFVGSFTIDTTVTADLEKEIELF